MEPATIQRLAAIPIDQLNYITRNVENRVVSLCQNTPERMTGMPNLVQLQAIYPGIQGNLFTLFELLQADISVLARFFIQHYGCQHPFTGNIIREMIQRARNMNQEHVADNMNTNTTTTNRTMSMDRSVNMAEQNMDMDMDRSSSQGSIGGGAKYKYKGRMYVVRRGERCGKYILVKGKKVYLSQI